MLHHVARLLQLQKMPDNDLGNGAGGKILNENLTQAEASLTT